MKKHCAERNPAYVCSVNQPNTATTMYQFLCLTRSYGNEPCRIQIAGIARYYRDKNESATTIEIIGHQDTFFNVAETVDEIDVMLKSAAMGWKPLISNTTNKA